MVVSSSLGDSVPGEEVALLRTEGGAVAVTVNGVDAGSIDVAAAAELEKFTAHRDRAEQGAQLRAVTKCSSAAPYTLIAKWAGSDYGWFYNASGQPSTTSLNRMQSAASTIANGSSSACGALSNGLSVTYAGTLAQAPAVTPTGCGAYDPNSVVGWGDLSGNTLARTCSYYNPVTDTQYVADIMFDNTGRSWFTTSSTSGCSNAFDLQGVATHEFGHAVGLGHVADDEPQVMNPHSDLCQTDMRQLGSGDQNGLRAHYGA